MVIRTRSLLGRVLSFLPYRWTPYCLYAVRVGQDVTSYMEITLKWRRK